jgi:putative nucleotidyltransferase with HDIG domain
MSKKNNIIPFPSIAMTMTFMDLAKKVDDLKNEKRGLEELAARVILKALDCKDHYTFDHSMRVAYFCVITGKEMSLTEKELKTLELSGLFHDIGKIGTPDHVLNKPSRLSEEEFLIMKKHPEQSYEILKEFPQFDEVAFNARHHHERYDGRGYPEGLNGEKIPLFSRIILIADTFDAMTSTRVYRKGMDYEVAFEELRQFSGTQFDPQCVKHFITAMKKEAANPHGEFFIDILSRSFQKKAS